MLFSEKLNLNLMLYARNMIILGLYMKYLGLGYCGDDFYAGWDGEGREGDASEQDCKNLCMEDDSCKFVAYLDTGNRKKCSRYNKDKCNLDTTNIKYDAKNQKTYAKTGLSFTVTLLLLFAFRRRLFAICHKIQM